MLQLTSLPVQTQHILIQQSHKNKADVPVNIRAPQNEEPMHWSFNVVTFYLRACSGN